MKTLSTLFLIAALALTGVAQAAQKPEKAKGKGKAAAHVAKAPSGAGEATLYALGLT